MTKFYLGPMRLTAKDVGGRKTLVSSMVAGHIKQGRPVNFGPATARGVPEKGIEPYAVYPPSSLDILLRPDEIFPVMGPEITYNCSLEEMRENLLLSIDPERRRTRRLEFVREMQLNFLAEKMIGRDYGPRPTELINEVESVETVYDLAEKLRMEKGEPRKELAFDIQSIIMPALPLLSGTFVASLPRENLWMRFLFGDSALENNKKIAQKVGVKDAGGNRMYFIGLFNDRIKDWGEDLIFTFLHESIHLGQRLRLKNVPDDPDDCKKLFCGAMKEGYTEIRTRELYQELFDNNHSFLASGYGAEMEIVKLLFRAVGREWVEKEIYNNDVFVLLPQILGKEKFEALAQFYDKFVSAKFKRSFGMSYTGVPFREQFEQMKRALLEK